MLYQDYAQATHKTYLPILPGRHALIAFVDSLLFPTLVSLQNGLVVEGLGLASPFAE